MSLFVEWYCGISALTMIGCILSEWNTCYLGSPIHFISACIASDQINGSSWIWYCGKSDCWIVSDLAPNDEFCKAGLISPKNETSTDPIYTINGLWSYWNYHQWLLDEEENRHVMLHCNDK